MGNKANTHYETASPSSINKDSFRYKFKKSFERHKHAYLMIVPVLIFYIIFCYVPMYGVIIAFKRYSPALGMLGSPWVGLDHFINFFSSPSFGRVIKNTFFLNVYGVLFTFPIPIIFALMVNEVRNNAFKRSIQTISYLPYFMSMVVIAGMIKSFTMSDGIINDFLAMFGFKPAPLLQQPGLFKPIFIISDIWQLIGWNSIIYFAALSAVNTELYEAARIDGAGKVKQIFHVSLPCIMPTIIIMLILRLGQMFSSNFEKVLLLYNDAVLSTSDVISTYVYRAGIQENNMSFGTAVGLFNSFLNIIFLVLANNISAKAGETSLF